MQNSTPAPPTKSTSGKGQERGPPARTDEALAALSKGGPWRLIFIRQKRLLQAMKALMAFRDALAHSEGVSTDVPGAPFEEGACSECSAAQGLCETGQELWDKALELGGIGLTGLADAILGAEEK